MDVWPNPTGRRLHQTTIVGSRATARMSTIQPVKVVLSAPEKDGSDDDKFEDVTPLDPWKEIVEQFKKGVKK